MGGPSRCTLFALAAALAVCGGRGEGGQPRAEQRKTTGKIDPAGRDRPPMPELTQPVMFNTPEADRILAGAPGLSSRQPVE